MSFRRLKESGERIKQTATIPVMISRKIETPSLDIRKLRQAVDGGKLDKPAPPPQPLPTSRVWNECIRCHEKIEATIYKKHLKSCMILSKCMNMHEVV